MSMENYYILITIGVTLCIGKMLCKSICKRTGEMIWNSFQKKETSGNRPLFYISELDPSFTDGKREFELVIQMDDETLIQRIRVDRLKEIPLKIESLKNKPVHSPLVMEHCLQEDLDIQAYNHSIEIGMNR